MDFIEIQVVYNPHICLVLNSRVLTLSLKPKEGCFFLLFSSSFKIKFFITEMESKTLQLFIPKVISVL